MGVKSINECGDDDGGVACNVGQQDSVSYTVEWGADISAAGWITAGFSVSETTSTGNSYECTNESSDDEFKNRICMWRRVGHT